MDPSHRCTALSIPQPTPYLLLQLLMDHLPQPELASQLVLTALPHILCGLLGQGREGQ